MTEQTLFQQLNSKDVNDHVEKKNGLTYLAWSYAHQELKKIDPTFTTKYHEFPHPDVNRDDYFVPYLATPEGYFIQTSVTVKGQTETEWLPVLDFRNKALAKGSATPFDINKAQKRCFVKAAALHGLGLYIYNGEEVPSASDNDITELEEKIKQFVTISQEKGKDANLDKTMRWLGISNINKVSQKEIANAHVKLDAGLKQLDKDDKDDK
ncbi:DUF1071 domain-containing protein [Staphylococcus saprophyticus]|uniref:Sak single strand annealing protein n=1 Tax=Staphylococcus saprophyticus TaxID=29385 RepID=UPI0019D00977|nr:DUF1071 domain-containing protein [Staphylococcus saprophyticus]MBN6755903.1 DUF1071 domain-containing protein [Staphylococcus saprophyticus]MBN6765881.1 DUF1071 domain-containing protein [Staphylococcus saprophyticus]MBN6771218.1 DUF1071 domain-containing protein [Staphylococcus saprophyticus]MBN6780216.1 DUF1071 domain-containing protein [Staphylococcus saprophyticus]MBN6787646.1 DUF1071 domain-containing protein [Staphylococcus saprophyticus]